jgi:hypothetical protein
MGLFAKIKYEVIKLENEIGNEFNVVVKYYFVIGFLILGFFGLKNVPFLIKIVNKISLKILKRKILSENLERRYLARHTINSSS